MRAVASTMCLSCALAALATSASAAEKAIWGPLTMPDGTSAMRAYNELGVDVLQMALDWDGVAPTRPTDPGNPSDPAYRWPASIDRAISEGATNGIRIALQVSRSPGWANGARSPAHAPTPADFRSFVAAASRRYPKVRRWMIWGEPNRDDRFLPNDAGGPAGPRAYAVILDAAYEGLKGVSGRNVVIGGMTWTGGTVKPPAFLSFMRLPNGRRPRLDWFGHNPFPFRFPDLREVHIGGGWRDISDMDVFSREVRRVYGRKVPLWLSEFTVLSGRPSRQFATAVSRRAQAAWLSAAYRIADALPSIAGLGWVGLLDEPEGPGSSNFGLLTASGGRKPAYAAFRTAPAVRFRPRVQGPRRVSRRNLMTRGLAVRVRPKLPGRITVELRSNRGRRMATATRRGHPRRAVSLRLVHRRVKRGHYVLAVRAFRAETVRRGVRVK